MISLRYITLSFASTVLLLASGCGSKEDESVIAPPPAAPSVGVSMTVGADAVASSTISAENASQAPNGAPPADGTSPDSGDIYKGMNEQQIQEFKATTTPETHDLNIPIIQEAITGFSAEFKRAPANQEEMVKARYLQRVLSPGKGKKYVINPETLEVTIQ